jgi:hypothetical protein
VYAADAAAMLMDRTVTASRENRKLIRNVSAEISAGACPSSSIGKAMSRSHIFIILLLVFHQDAEGRLAVFEEVAVDAVVLGVFVFHAANGVFVERVDPGR